MATPKPSPFDDHFQADDPAQIFQGYCAEERQRAHDTEPEFDLSLHQEAEALVLRLLTGTEAAPAPEESSQ